MMFPSQKMGLFGSGSSNRRPSVAFAVGQQVFQFAHVELQLVNVLPWSSGSIEGTRNERNIKEPWCVAGLHENIFLIVPTCLDRNPSIHSTSIQRATSTAIPSRPLPWCPSPCRGQRRQWPWWCLMNDGRGTTSCRSRWTHATTWGHVDRLGFKPPLIDILWYFVVDFEYSFL